MTREELKRRIDEWERKVLCAYDFHTDGVSINTLNMIMDIDEIITEAFDHDYVIER